MDTNSPQATPASSWKGRKGAPVELPSGNIALLRRPGIEHFLRSGNIPNSLKNVIRSAMGKDGEGKLNELMEDDQSFIELFELMDRILVEVVVEPKVKPVPMDRDGKKILIDDRDDQFIYVDEVDLEDKTFIFQYAMGGTKDLERFRSEQKGSLGNLHAQQDMEDTPEHNGSNDG